MTKESKMRTIHIRNKSSNKGGVTIISAWHVWPHGAASTEYIDVGVARCSDKDNFNRKIGRHVAEGRLKKQPITLSKAEYLEFVDELFVQFQNHSIKAKVVA